MAGSTVALARYPVGLKHSQSEPDCHVDSTAPVELPEPADSQPQQNPPSTDDNGVGIGDDGAHANNAVNDQGASHDDRSSLDESWIPPNSTIAAGEPGKVSNVEPPSGPVTSASIEDGNNPENSQVTSQEETAIRPSSCPRKRPKSSNKPTRCKNVPSHKGPNHRRSRLVRVMLPGTHYVRR